MLTLNISYNIAQPYATIYNQSSTTTYVRPAVWGPYVMPTKTTISNGFIGLPVFPANVTYYAWTFLWEITPSTIPSCGPLLKTGLWINYMRSTNTTQGGKSSFVNDNGFIELNRADIAGSQPTDSALLPHGPNQGLTATQTQSVPDGVLDANDFFYFMDAYINYYVNHTYNPLADFDSNGKIDGGDFLDFMGIYVNYFESFGGPVS